jgi:hypothetical protein
MVYNATFNNISAISWLSIFSVEETGENHRTVASHWETLSNNVVSSTPSHVWAGRSLMKYFSEKCDSVLFIVIFNMINGIRFKMISKCGFVDDSYLCLFLMRLNSTQKSVYIRLSNNNQWPSSSNMRDYILEDIIKSGLLVGP